MGKFVPASEMSLSDQVQIRREKLAQLQAEGMTAMAASFCSARSSGPW